MISPISDKHLIPPCNYQRSWYMPSNCVHVKAFSWICMYIWGLLTRQVCWYWDLKNFKVFLKYVPDLSHFFFLSLPCNRPWAHLWNNGFSCPECLFMRWFNCYGEPFCLLEVRVIIICWRGTPEHVVDNTLLPFLDHSIILFSARASIFPVPK